jgi:condensin complex subunit 1
MEMNNPIFHRLQDALEHDCRSKEWFGMAEQVINTIYALGEHPDVLCNDLIKKLTIKAFSRNPKTNDEGDAVRDPDAMDADKSMDVEEESISARETLQGDTDKDTGDAFELSKLLFVVGHVAIKHIVFLELVEREWKRQKDEKQAGEPIISVLSKRGNLPLFYS